MDTLGKILSTIGITVSIIVSIVTISAGIIEPALAAILSIEIILVTLVIYILIKINNMSKFLELTKIFIDTIYKIMYSILENINNKRLDESITWHDAKQFADNLMRSLAMLGQSAFSIYARDIHSTEEEKRKKMLMEKARRKEISLEEAEELKKLIEKEKKEYEKKGDIVNAILLGATLLFVAWLIYELLRGKKK